LLGWLRVGPPVRRVRLCRKKDPGGEGHKHAARAWDPGGLRAMPGRAAGYGDGTCRNATHGTWYAL
jgi:hypothetical protein